MKYGWTDNSLALRDVSTCFFHPALGPTSHLNVLSSSHFPSNLPVYLTRHIEHNHLTPHPVVWGCYDVWTSLHLRIYWA